MFQLLTEVFKLVNLKQGTKYMREAIEIKEAIDREMEKDPLKRDMARVDKLELRLMRIAQLVATEIARSNTSTPS